MRSIAHHDHGQKPERMKFLRIIFGCPEGARKWRILFFAMLLHSKNCRPQWTAVFLCRFYFSIFSSRPAFLSAGLMAKYKITLTMTPTTALMTDAGSFESMVAHVVSIG